MITTDMFETRHFDQQAFQDELQENFFDKLKGYDFQFDSVTLKTPDSKWKVSSALQKSIRRGLPLLASRYAQAFIHGGQSEYFWTRIPVIALEDIGPANIELCAFILMCSRFKTIRMQVQEDKLVAFICHEMAAGVKSRAYCDLVCSWSFDPTMKMPSDSLFHALKYESFQHAKQLGVSDPVDPSKDVPAYLKALDNTTLPAPHWYTLTSSTKKSVYGLHSSILPFWKVDTCSTYEVVHECEATAGELVGGVPLWAFDQHVLEGKKSIAYLVKSLELNAKMPYLASTKALGMVMFQIESALLDRRLSTPIIDLVKKENDRQELVSAGIPSTHHQACRDFLMLEESQAEITRVRRRIVEGKPA